MSEHEDAGGEIQDNVNGLTGDAAKLVKGKWSKAAAHAQDALGASVDGMRESIAGKPLIAVGIVAVAFFTIGFLSGASGKTKELSPDRSGA